MNINDGCPEKYPDKPLINLIVKVGVLIYPNVCVLIKTEN